MHLLRPGGLAAAGAGRDGGSGLLRAAGCGSGAAGWWGAATAWCGTAGPVARCGPEGAVGAVVRAAAALPAAKPGPPVAPAAPAAPAAPVRGETARKVIVPSSRAPSGGWAARAAGPAVGRRKTKVLPDSASAPPVPDAVPVASAARADPASSPRPARPPPAPAASPVVLAPTAPAGPSEARPAASWSGPGPEAVAESAAPEPAP
ncbi:hypothetical protein D3C59_20430, partial [Streptomyces sp. SHP22-7]